MNATRHHLPPAKLLWTGGWDSTFQLLRLAYVEGRRVEPCYLIDESRGSTGVELLAMKNIRLGLRRHDARAATRVGPTRFFSVMDMAEEATTRRAYENVLQSRFIGLQYLWLARFCRQQGIAGLQLCIHREDKAAAVVAPLVVPVAEKPEVFRVATRHAGSDEHTLFGRFEFPLLTMSKLDMQARAEAGGFLDLMYMTWFCHHPVRGKPCGCCNPCRYTVEEGLGWRLPLSRRIGGRIRRTVTIPAKRVVKRMLTGGRGHESAA